MVAHLISQSQKGIQMTNILQIVRKTGRPMFVFLKKLNFFFCRHLIDLYRLHLAVNQCYNIPCGMPVLCQGSVGVYHPSTCICMFTLNKNNLNLHSDNKILLFVTSADHLIFSRLVRQPKSLNFRTLVLSLLLFLGLTV